MASKYWIKLYHDILDDGKVGRMTDRQFRRMIELFLVAGEEGEEGELPSCEDIAWRLWRRKNATYLEKDMDALMEIGVLEKPNGKWRIKNFKKRQAAMSSAERAGRYRKSSGF